PGLVLEVEDSVRAIVPAVPCCNSVTKVLLAYPEPAESAVWEPLAPKLASKIGSAAWPGRPQFAKVFAVWLLALTPALACAVLQAAEFAWQMLRLPCACWNCGKNPFSKILTSFRFWKCHMCVLLLPM